MTVIPQAKANNWYVITGGPGAGKSTLIAELARRGYHTVPEQARALIEAGLARGQSLEEIRADQAAFQRRVFELQLAAAADIPPQQLTFFDRGIPDNAAYMRFHGLPLDERRRRAIAACSYRKVFLLELLPLVTDSARGEDLADQLAIHRCVAEIYSELPFPVVKVPVMSVAERAELVLGSL